MTVIVVTAGQTDVQLRLDHERLEFNKDQCAVLHDELAGRTDWTLADSDVKKSRSKISSLPDGPFQLCTPKLDAVLGYASQRGIRIDAALIFDTRRDQAHERGDPRHAGVILQRRLLQCLQDQLVTEPRVVTCLSDAERLEDSTNPRDATIRREVVDRIAAGCRTSVSQSSHVLVAATGGIPVVSSLVEQVVRLFAGPVRVDVLDTPEVRSDSQIQGVAVLRSQVPSPHMSYEARRRALDLVRSGHLLGAWGAVRHLHDDDVERLWTQVIEWLRLWVCALPMPAACDIDLLKHSKRAVRAALRVEFALRAGDLASAIHGTVAFFEAALWDHLDLHVRPHPTIQKRFRANAAPGANLVKNGSEDDRKRPFSIDATIPDDGDGPWYRIDDSAVCARRLVRHYLEAPNLEKLGQAVEKVQGLRNDVAHNVPTEALMEQARHDMRDAALWSCSDTFLDVAVVADTLSELGVDNGGCLADSLVEDVQRRLRAHSSQGA
jgi:hypothetical protein